MAIELGITITDPEPCPYLPDRLARNEVHLLLRLGDEEYGQALRSGFRRFGRIVFRPACASCRACTPLRVAVDRFAPSRSQRRVLRRNRDVELEVGEPRVDQERLDLYHAFHRERTQRVGWKPQEITAEDYRHTFIENIRPTLELRYRIEGRLGAVAYVDEAPDAMNSIYCFYHPDFSRRSLGTLDVLAEIELAAHRGRRWLYLGYHIAGCRSLAYKAAFRPAEALLEGRWTELTEPGSSGRAPGSTA